MPPEQLLSLAGEDAEFEYDHSIFWPALSKLAEQRRKAYHERRVMAGKRIGESEFYLRGGTEKSVYDNEDSTSHE